MSQAEDILQALLFGNSQTVLSMLERVSSVRMVYKSFFGAEAPYSATSDAALINTSASNKDEIVVTPPQYFVGLAVDAIKMAPKLEPPKPMPTQCLADHIHSTSANFTVAAT